MLTRSLTLKKGGMIFGELAACMSHAQEDSDCVSIMGRSCLVGFSGRAVVVSSEEEDVKNVCAREMPGRRVSPMVHMHGTSTEHH